MLDFGILGINARNLHYIGKHNPEKAIRLADNKITTKTFLSERGIPLPATYAVIKNRAELAQFDFFSIPHTHFIIKPARGSRGRGIFRVKKIKEQPTEGGLFTAPLISQNRWTRLFGFKKDADELIDQHWFEVHGKMTSESLLKTYCLDILDGNESMQGKPDHILIEELLLPGDGFENFCAHGLADIRVIVYNFVPVAAMLRVPTQTSEGKANLDRGGVGLGVEVGSGEIQSMFLHGKVYKTTFPEPYVSFLGAKISYREDILQRSTQIQYYVNLGYLALDRVITETGPKLLEINARAGLKIQLALDMPLRKRLEKVGDLKISSPEKGVEICQTLFTKKKTGLVSPNKVIPLHGYATLFGSDGVYHEVTVTIDLTKVGVWFDPLLAKVYAPGASKFLLRYITTEARIAFHTFGVDKSLLSHHIVLGNDLLTGYFIKPVPVMKKDIFNSSMLVSTEYDSLRLLDTKLGQIHGKLILSRYLKPINFLQEFDKFLSLEGKYNPVFVYQRPSQKKLLRIKDELAYLRDEFVSQLHLQSPVLALFLEKLDELTTKATLLQAYKAQDLGAISSLQESYRGVLDNGLLEQAKAYLAKPAGEKEVLGPLLSHTTLKKHIRQYLKFHGRDDVEIRFTPETFARMHVKKRGSTLILQISSGARFRKLELFATLAHELIHLERYMNGQRAERGILKRGTAKYFIDEEGLAVWTAEQELPEAYEKVSMRKKYALLAEAKKYNFMQMGDFILSKEERTLMGLFKTIYRMKRGIVETSSVDHRAICYQDTIYVHGYQRISDRIATGHDIQDLKRGKIKIEDLRYFL